jgi:hypothetical protein
MATIISRVKYLMTDDFEMAESFGITTKEKTKDDGNEFPMQTP